LDRNLHPAQSRRSKRLLGLSPDQSLSPTPHTQSSHHELDSPSLSNNPGPSDSTSELTSLSDPENISLNSEPANTRTLEEELPLDLVPFGLRPQNPYHSPDDFEMPEHGETSFTLPARHSDKAPRFDRKQPSTLKTYIEDYEHLAGKAKLDIKDKIQRFSMYMDPQDSDYIATLTEYTTGNNWQKFIEEVYSSYPGSKPSDRYSIDDLYSLCNVQAVMRIVTRSDFANFDRSFQRIAHGLVSEEIAGESEINRQYWAALDPAFRERVKTRLEISKPNHPARCPWDRKDVRETAMKLLENAPSTSAETPATTSHITTSGPPAANSPAPVIKTEVPDLEDFLQKMSMMLAHSVEQAAQNVANRITAIQMRDNPPYRPPIPRNNVNYNQGNNLPNPRFENRNRDGIVYGPPGSRPRSGCFMCHNPGHFLSNCELYQQYLATGKCRRGRDGVVRLSNGEPLPTEPIGTPWVQRIDDFYVKNPHLLPQGAPQEQNNNSGNNVQSNFVSVFAIPEVGMVDSEEQQSLCLLRNQINALIQEATSAPAYERPSIETTINVLNTRLRKREEVAKEKTKSKTGKPEPPKSDPKTMQPTGAIPHVDIPAMQPRERQPKPPPALPLPPPIAKGPNGPQYRYRAPVESEEAHKKVYEKILEQTVVLTVEECIATMPVVRKYFKDAITGKRVPTEEEKAAGLVEVSEPTVCSTFSVGIEPKVEFEAKPSLALRCIEIMLNESVRADGIIDCGCQVILMRKEIWTKLRIPLMAKKVLSMESANGTRNFTAGLIPRVKFTIGSVNLWCPVQVVENAPFDLLIGRPFMALTQSITRDFYDGNMEITITDPETGEVLTVPTYPRPDLRDSSKENTESAILAASQFMGFH
jgi:hypothetical protein